MANNSSLKVPSQKKAKRVRNCDDCPAVHKVDPNFWVNKYSPVFMEPGKGGVIRDITSFVSLDGVRDRFAGISESSVSYGQSCSKDGMSRDKACSVTVHKCFEMDVELIDNPTVPVNESTFDPIANPIYIVPWVDPNGGGEGVPALSGTRFDTSLDPRDAIGVVKQLCPESSRCDDAICVADTPAPSDTSDYQPEPACPTKVVYAKFTTDLPGC